VALLLALVCLSIVSGAAATLLRAAADASTRTRLGELDTAAPMLARDAERVGLAWLGRGGFALPPDGDAVDITGFVRIASVQEVGVRVRIDAIDLSGRLHVTRLHPRAASGSSALGGLRGLGGLPPPLDRLGDITLVDSARGGAREADVDPLSRPSLPAMLRAGGIEDDVAEFPRLTAHDGPLANEGGAASLWVTDHGQPPYAVNIDTCPADLLEALLIDRDPGARGRALASRREGRRVPAVVVASLNASAPPGAVPLTNTSSVVGLLITVRLEDAAFAARFWTVAERVTESSRVGTGSPWRIVERRRAGR